MDGRARIFHGQLRVVEQEAREISPAPRGLKLQMQQAAVGQAEERVHRVDMDVDARQIGGQLLGDGWQTYAQVPGQHRHQGTRLLLEDNVEALPDDSAAGHAHSYPELAGT